MARVYAVTVPCAAACAPFKSSPQTYIACCKQHAAAAVKPKPVAAKPVSNIIKSALPKPASTGQLHQGQVTFADYFIDTQKIRKPLPYTGPIQNAKPVPQNITNNYYSQPPPVNQTSSSAPSGGGGCGNVPMECHNHGYRNEGERGQPDNSFAYGGKFLVPDSHDQLTLEFGGKPHVDDISNRDEYKVGFDEAGKGVYLQKQGKDYGVINKADNSIQVKAGQMVDIQITKQNVGPESNPTAVDITVSVDGRPVGHWRDIGSNPIDGIPPYYVITGSPPARVRYRQDGLLNCYNKSCCKQDEHRLGPSVLCGSLWYKPLPNLSS